MAAVKTRERLLAAAERMFAERGFEGVSVREIVAAADANLGAVTYHFGGKDGLFAEVINSKTQPLLDLGREILASDDAPVEKLRHLLEVYAFAVMHHDPGLKVLFAETMMGGSRLPQATIDAVNERNEIFATIVRDGIDAGDFRSCDTECAAWSFFGMLSAYILYQPLMPAAKRDGAYSSAYVRRVVDAALDVFLNGLMPNVKQKKRARGAEDA